MIRRTHFKSGACMRRIIQLAACVVIGLMAASCGNPVLERKYINEGAGVDLYSGDADNQIALLNQYIAFICTQMGQGPGSCNVGSQTFVIAGMNDIDQRCDGYLTWLDARRRDQTPVLAEISAIQGATHDIMAITGSSVKSLNIVTTAFALASATYTNWNSRLLVSVNQSTVQEVVYNSQWKYREKIKTAVIPDQPTAIYLLRNYLRLCMPITIEASINTSTTLVQLDAPTHLMQPLVVQSTSPPRAAPPPVIHANTPPPITQVVAKSVGNPLTDLERKSISFADAQSFQRMLCVEDSGDFGPSGSVTRTALKQFFIGQTAPRDSSANETVANTTDLRKLRDAQAVFPSCRAAGLTNAFEVGLFSRAVSTTGTVNPMTIIAQVGTALTNAGLAVPAQFQSANWSPAVADALHQVIPDLRTKLGLPDGSALDRALYIRIARSGSNN